MPAAVRSPISHRKLSRLFLSVQPSLRKARDIVEIETSTLCSLPQLAVFLQCGVVLFEPVPKGPSLFDALTDGESKLGIRLGCNRSRLSSQSEIGLMVGSETPSVRTISFLGVPRSTAASTLSLRSIE
jgi:hypothetical protein